MKVYSALAFLSLIGCSAPSPDGNSNETSGSITGIHCNDDGSVACLNTEDKENISSSTSTFEASNLKAGVELCGVTGTFPSESSLLEKASDTVSDLSKYTEDSAGGVYEFWDSAGKRHEVDIKNLGKITPELEEKSFHSALFGPFSVNGDPNLKAENIKSGVSIFGVDGTFNFPACSATKTTDCLANNENIAVNVASVPADKILSGTSIAGVSGTKVFQNSAPIISAINDISIDLGDPISAIDVAALSNDADGNSMTYSCYFDFIPDGSVAKNLACNSATMKNGSGFSFNETTGDFSAWTPDGNGMYEFMMEACDQYGACGQTTFTVKIGGGCSGKEFLGFCLHYSGLTDDSCNDVCTGSNGAYSNATKYLLGSKGTDDLCKVALSELGQFTIGDTIFRDSDASPANLGLGCYVDLGVPGGPPLQGAREISTATDASSKSSNARRVCLCKGSD